MRLLLLLAAFFALPVSGLPAQTGAPLLPGTRVRVWTESGGRAVGGVQRTAPDTLVLTAEGNTGTLLIPRAAITRLEVSAGSESRSRKAVRWAGRGFVGSAVFFGSLCALAEDCRVGESSRVESVAAAAAWYGMGGATWGAMLGALFPGEEWRTVWPPAPVGVAPDGRGGVAVGVFVRH